MSAVQIALTLRGFKGEKKMFTVSICVVAYNEQELIGKLLDNILAQTYPKNLTEIVLVDSLSTDRTHEIFDKFRAEHFDRYKNIIVTDNPKRKQASGWNVAIKSSTGDIIFRIDAHAEIPPEFVENNVKHHEEGEMVTGGARPNIIDGSTPYKQTLLMAESSVFGSSAADFRRNGKKRYVKSLFHGAYRREVFEKAGLFNETLGRTEDNEMHYRIRQAGYKICLCPDVISYQHTRSSLKKMLKQKYSNGYWVGRTKKICPGCISTYHLVPFVFVLGIIAALLLGFVSPVFPILFFGCYFAAAIFMTVKAIKEQEKFYAVYLILPLLFFLLHSFYGVGTAVGFISLITNPVKRK